jgi:hypothetical protein
MISSPKMIIIIFWSSLDFHAIQALPPKVIFTSEFFVDAILPYIVAAKLAGDPGRRLALHMDSAAPHCARLIARNLEENRTTANPHRAFSPDLAPSDFFLFGALNDQLSGRIFESPEELVQAIREIASAIPRTTVARVVLNGKKDRSNISTPMVPMSTKVYDHIIYSLRFCL